MMRKPLGLLIAVAILLAPNIGWSQVVGLPPATTADPQPVPVVLCRSSLPCLQQMVDDLRSYRTYLEDQLSLAKSLLLEANQRIAQQVKEIQGLRVPPETGEKK